MSIILIESLFENSFLTSVWSQVVSRKHFIIFVVILVQSVQIVVIRLKLRRGLAQGFSKRRFFIDTHIEKYRRYSETQVLKSNM